MHALHKNMHNCTRLFRSFSFFLLFLLLSIWQKPSFFVFFSSSSFSLFVSSLSLSSSSTERILLQYTMPWQQCYMCLRISSFVTLFETILSRPKKKKKHFLFLTIYWSSSFFFSLSLSLTNYAQLFINLHV